MLYFRPGMSPAIVAERSIKIYFPSFELFHLKVPCKDMHRRLKRCINVLCCADLH